MLTLTAYTRGKERNTTGKRALTLTFLSTLLRCFASYSLHLLLHKANKFKYILTYFAFTSAKFCITVRSWWVSKRSPSQWEPFYLGEARCGKSFFCFWFLFSSVGNQCLIKPIFNSIILFWSIEQAPTYSLTHSHLGYAYVLLLMWRGVQLKYIFYSLSWLIYIYLGKKNNISRLVGRVEKYTLHISWSSSQYICVCFTWRKQCWYLETSDLRESLCWK